MDSMLHLTQRICSIFAKSGYQACKALLEKMLVTKEETAWLPGQRRCMQEESESKEFMEDPCCSESARFEKCCPLQDVQDKITIIHDTRLDQDCDGALSFELTNALKGVCMCVCVSQFLNVPQVGQVDLLSLWFFFRV
jgi:hypothetical protein